jgi:HEAT repeat protein
MFVAFPLMTQPRLPSGEAPGFLKGKVVDLSGSAAALDKKIESARAEAQKAKAGDLFFTAYLFESRHRIHRGREGRISEGFVIGTKEAKIKIEEFDKGKNRVEVEGQKEDAPAPAALLFLHSQKDGLLDVSLLDPDQSYDFSDTFVYWLGRATNDESLALVEKWFESAGSKTPLQGTLVFITSCHPGPRAPDFLKRVALGSYSGKVRESAVFWLGNYSDSKSLTYLKEIFAKSQDTGIKKQVVFALQLSKQKEAVEELIRIAKNEPSQDIRKTAVFWLGQKASAESIKALKEIVDGPEEESKLKEQAVFAISQLPKEKSVPMLIDIAKTNKSPSVRKKAIFWLGQTGDESALKFFEEILLKK